MRTPSSALLLLVVLGVLAGCLADAPQAKSVLPGPQPRQEEAVAIAKVDAGTTLKDLQSFSESYPYRQSGTQTHLLSRDWLEKALKDAGLEVVRQKFPSSGGPAAAAGYTGENIIGIKWGSDRDHWVVVGAHYDITEGAVFGTYDDGSGTIQTVELARAYAKIPTNRTVAFILFDQEERGLVGSAYFVKTVLDGKFQYNITVDSMVDLDMVGIMHPHAAKLVGWQNSPQVKSLAEQARNTSKVPDGKVEYRKPKGGSSDGASFIKVGIPTIYYWSDWDEVVTKDAQPVPGSYPWWHRVDTYATMVAMAGDPATLQAGFQNLLDIASYLVAHMAASDFEADTDA